MDQTKLTPDFVDAYWVESVNKIKKIVYRPHPDALLLEFRKQQLHKKDGVLIQWMRTALQWPNPERRKSVLKAINIVKEKLELLIATFLSQSNDLYIGRLLINTFRVDPTLPVLSNMQVALYDHPLHLLCQKLSSLFHALGYQGINHAPVVSEKNNFDYLNIDPDHPARAAQDTFYLQTKGYLLQTHNTAVTADILSHPEKYRIDHQKIQGFFSIGTVFRRDTDDATHAHQFHQVDVVVVGPGVSYRHLVDTIRWILQQIFGSKTKFNLRASHFPFTLPSLELDIWHPTQKKFIEVLGGGMIHPQVFSRCQWPKQHQSGFAFAFGIERLAMIYYGIDNIHDFFLNDVTWLQRFSY